MRIITISREFGSGGRELGKRLAEALGIPCYDNEIINEVAALQGVDPKYVQFISESEISKIYSYTIGRTLSSSLYYDQQASNILSAQFEVIKRLASQGDCVFIGHYSDYILKEFNPINIFVYADEESKLERCLKHIKEGETPKGILKQMKQVDKCRIANHKILSEREWGNKESYDLCINTSNKEIKQLISPLAEFIKRL